MATPRRVGARGLQAGNWDLATGNSSPDLPPDVGSYMVVGLGEAGWDCQVGRHISMSAWIGRFSSWVTVLVAAVPAGLAQGTFLFTNSNGAKTVPFTDCAGKPIAGDGYRVEVLVLNPKTGAVDPGVELLATGGTNWVKLAPVGFLEGKAAGLFVGGTVRVPFVAPGQEAKLTLRAWEVSTGADFASAKVRGETNITIKLGAIGSPPSFPSRLRPLQGLKICPVK